jgi:adenosylcobinamide-GDP ribazoletransferase
MIREAVKRLLFAFGFLTAVPGLGGVQADAGASSTFFPLVGAFLGVCIFGMSFIELSPLSVAVFIVIFLLIATRGIHADGILDTFDGFLSGRSEKEKLLAIMKDSNIGALGFVSAFCIYLLKIIILYEILRAVPDAYRSLLILPPVLSRGGVSLYCRAFQPAAKGMGTLFASTIKTGHILLSFVIMELLSFRRINWAVLFMPLFILGLWMVWGIICRKKIGGFTGDTIGAGIEMTEVAGFALVSFVYMKL